MSRSILNEDKEYFNPSNNNRKYQSIMFVYILSSSCYFPYKYMRMPIKIKKETAKMQCKRSVYLS